MKTPCHSISVIRSLLRIGVLLALFAIVGFNHFLALKSQYGGQFEIDESPLMSLVDKATGSNPHRSEYDVSMSGNLWSFRFLELRASDPLAVLSGVLVSRSFPLSLLLSLLLPVFLTICFGRFFCGWLCPMGLFGEMVSGLRRLLGRWNISFFSLTVSRKSKYAILAVGSVICLLTSLRFFYAFYPPRIISDWARDPWFGPAGAGGYVFVGAILLVELLLCERVWCKCLCPGGALYSMMGASRVVRVRWHPHACTRCGKCDEVCPYDLAPSKGDPSCECDNCGKCVEVCSDGALTYGVVGQRRGME